MKSKVTKYMDICICCGEPATDTHHLLFGTFGRKFADNHGLIIPLCRSCHTSAERISERIHDNPRAEDLCKLLGQAIWERNYYKDLYYNLNRDEDEARERFIELYGQSFM